MLLVWVFLLGAATPQRVDKAFLGKYVYETAVGTYVCAECQAPLFASNHKYNAGSGWPCFTQAIDSKSVYYLEDHSLSFKRYEVVCRNCDGRLGHVFNDGPEPKGLRYTIHSSALIFIKSH